MCRRREDEKIRREFINIFLAARAVREWRRRTWPKFFNMTNLISLPIRSPSKDCCFHLKSWVVSWKKTSTRAGNLCDDIFSVLLKSDDERNLSVVWGKWFFHFFPRRFFSRSPPRRKLLWKEEKKVFSSQKHTPAEGVWCDSLNTGAVRLSSPLLCCLLMGAFFFSFILWFI